MKINILTYQSRYGYSETETLYEAWLIRLRRLGPAVRPTKYQVSWNLGEFIDHVNSCTDKMAATRRLQKVSDNLRYSVIVSVSFAVQPLPGTG